MKSLTYLVLGHRHSGKDTFSELFVEENKISFYSSSFLVNEETVFPVLGPKYGYANPIACYEDRNNHRVEWRDLILAYNTPDRTRMARRILDTAALYCGMRSNEEFQACEKAGLFDYIFWIRATPRVEENDPSMDIEYDPSRMILINNSGTLEDLKRQVKIASEIVQGKANLISVDPGNWRLKRLLQTKAPWK